MSRNWRITGTRRQRSRRTIRRCDLCVTLLAGLDVFVCRIKVLSDVLNLCTTEVMDRSQLRMALLVPVPAPVLTAAMAKSRYFGG